MIYESELNDKLIIDLFNIICTKYGIYIMTGFTVMELLRQISDMHYRIGPGYVSIAHIKNTFMYS